MSSEEDLKQKLSRWLSENGYPLEMRVAEAARKHTRFEIRQGWHYVDPESSSSREIDIVCTASEPRGFAEINFVIECKATTKPWIIFSSEDAAASYNRLNTFGMFTKNAHSAIASHIFPSDLETPFDEELAKSIPWFWKEGLIGYAITQTFDGNKDVPYKASLSAVKAGIWLLSNSLWQSAKHRTYAASFPIIVTTSPLFECTLDSNGLPVLNRTNHGHLFFKQHINEFHATSISVVTEEQLELFMQECQTVADKLFKAMSGAMEEDWEIFLSEDRNTPNN